MEKRFQRQRDEMSDEAREQFTRGTYVGGALSSRRSREAGEEGSRRFLHSCHLPGGPWRVSRDLRGPSSPASRSRRDDTAPLLGAHPVAGRGLHRHLERVRAPALRAGAGFAGLRFAPNSSGKSSALALRGWPPAPLQSLTRSKMWTYMSTSYFVVFTV